MGARISVAFTNKGSDKSVTLCHHWGGEEFKNEVEDFLHVLESRIDEKKNGNNPLTRLEPSTVMVYFIAWLGETGQLTDSLYVVATPEECDDSDYGHHEFDLTDYITPAK